MSAMRSRRASALSALMLLLVLPLSAGPALGAESAVAAGEALLDKIASGDFSTLDEVVCAEQRDAIQAQFDPASQIGDLPEGFDIQELLDSLDISVEGGAVELVSEEAETATVRLTGTMHMTFFGVSDSQPLDEEYTVVLEDGEWLVCDDFGFGGSTTDVSLVSEEGVCAALSPDELNALGPQYASSFSTFDSCSYQPASFDDGYYSLGISINEGDLDSIRTFYAGGMDLVVGESAAYGQSGQLWVELPDGELLTISTFFSEDDSVAVIDPIEYAAQVAEIVLPRIPDVERSDFGSFGGDFVEPEPAPEVDLCAALTLDQLNALGSFDFDVVEGESGYCTYSSTDFTSGFRYVSTSLSPGESLELMAQFFPDGEELTVAELPAYYAFEQLFLEVDGQLLNVAAFVDDGSGASGSMNKDMAIQIAEIVVPRLADLVAAAVADQTVPAETSPPAEPGATDTLCDAIDVASIQALGLAYDSVEGTVSGCELSTPQYALRISAEAADLVTVRDVFPGGQDIEVGGYPAYTDGRTVWVEVGGFAGMFSVEPAFGLAEETTGIDRVEYASDVAEIVLAGIPGAS